MRTITPLALSLILLAACGEITPPVAMDAGAPSMSTAAVHVEDSFFATAACSGDIGFNIRFGGPREMVRHVAGTDTTLSFRAQAFQGWRLPETTFDQSTVDFSVLGGAEMFNIKRDESGALDVRIHEGTLVFAATDGSYKVVARHIIRIVPGQDVGVNRWECRITG